MRDAAIAIGQIEMYLNFLEFQAGEEGGIMNIFLARSSHANNIMLVRPLILRKPSACSLACWSTDTNGRFSQLTEGGCSHPANERRLPARKKGSRKTRHKT